jgi:hypothetical protein
MSVRHSCIPLHIGTGLSEAGPRLGGRAPRGLRPSVDDSARYLLTIPLGGAYDKEVSVFVCSNNEPLLTARGQLSTGAAVEAIAHPASLRGDVNDWSARLSEHPLLLDPPRSDWMLGDEGQPAIESNHKLGGRPYCLMENGRRREQLDELRARGYVQVLQLDVPGCAGDTGNVAGDWPFMDGMFHLFAVPPFAPHSWRWFWER